MTPTVFDACLVFQELRQLLEKAHDDLAAEKLFRVELEFKLASMQEEINILKESVR